MSKQGFHLFGSPKNGGSQTPEHGIVKETLICDSILSSESSFSCERSVLSSSKEDAISIAIPASSGNETDLEEIDSKCVANDAKNDTPTKSVFDFISKPKGTQITTFRRDESSMEWMKNKATDGTDCTGISVSSQDFDNLVGTVPVQDSFEMDSVGVGSGVGALTLPNININIDSNFLSTDFPDNLKDFVFSVTDNLSKNETSSQFESSSVEGAHSFSALLENEDSLTDNLQGVYKYERNAIQESVGVKEENCLLSNAVSSTIPRAIKEERIKAKSEEMKPQRFTTLKQSPHHSIGITIKSERSPFDLDDTNQNIFQSHLIKDDSFILTNLTSSVDQPSNITNSCSLNSMPTYQTNHSPVSCSLASSTKDLDYIDAVPNLLALSESSASSSALVDPSSKIHSFNVDSPGEEPLESPIESVAPVLNAQASSSYLTDQNVNVTTISISNNDKDATRILVDTNQGKKNLYVINAAALGGDQKNTKLILQENQPMFIVNSSNQVSPLHTLQTAPVINSSPEQQFVSLQSASTNMPGKLSFY